MKKIAIPVAAIVCGILIGTVWHFLSSSIYEEGFFPYRVGGVVDKMAQKNSEAARFADLEISNGEIFDANEIEVNRQYEHEFIVRNNGSDSLQMRLVQISRNCNSPTFDGKEVVVIAPGKARPVSLTWIARDANQSEFESQLTLATNDRNLKQVDLKIRGKLLPVTGAYPAAGSVKDMLQTDSRTFSFDAVSFLDEPFEIVGRELSDSLIESFFDVSETRLAEAELAKHKNLKGEVAKSGYRVTARIRPGLPIGYFEQAILLKTDIPENDSFSFLISGNIVGDLLVRCQSSNEFDETQSRVDLGEVAPGEVANETKMTLSFRDGAEIPSVLKVLEDQSYPKGMFKLSFERPVEQSSRLTVVPFSLTTDPAASRWNLVGPGTERYGRIVIGDGSGSILTVLYVKVRFIAGK